MQTSKSKQFNPLAAKQILRDNGIDPTPANVKKAVKLAPVLDGFKGYVDELELRVGAQKLARQLSDGGDLKATKPIHNAINDVKVARYDIDYNADDRSLIFDPAASLSPIGIRSTAKGINVGHTIKGGVEIKLGDEDSPLAIVKGKWAKATLADIARSDKDLKNLEKAGYNLHALRDVLVVKTEDGEQHYFAVRDLRLDKEAPVVPQKAMLKPGKQADISRGLVAISDSCTEVHVVGFEKGRPIVSIKKPVIYLYPERKTSLRVEVEVKGRFVAQYPQTKDGAWEVVANPDGTLFDTKTERRFSYLFWEAESDKEWTIDRDRAFCVSSDQVESFLESKCALFGLSDREKTDFISYWIAALKKNRFSLVQFLSGDECEAHSKLTVTPNPDSEIRMFMLFSGLSEPVKTGNPELSRLVRHRFTVVEWGGANLDD